MACCCLWKQSPSPSHSCPPLLVPTTSSWSAKPPLTPNSACPVLPWHACLLSHSPTTIYRYAKQSAWLECIAASKRHEELEQSTSVVTYSQAQSYAHRQFTTLMLQSHLTLMSRNSLIHTLCKLYARATHVALVLPYDLSSVLSVPDEQCHVQHPASSSLPLAC